MKTVLYHAYGKNALSKTFDVRGYFDTYDKAYNAVRKYNFYDVEKFEFSHKLPLNYFDGCSFTDLGLPSESKNKYLITCKDSYGNTVTYKRVSDTPEHAAENLAYQYHWCCTWSEGWYDEHKNDYAKGRFLRISSRNSLIGSCTFEVTLI